MLGAVPPAFVPNLGQWEHRARFVLRSGPMSMFLEDRGWVLDVAEGRRRPMDNCRMAGRLSACWTEEHAGRAGTEPIRAAAIRMVFEGGAGPVQVVGETRLAGYHNYFLGNDESRWRTGVPLYASVRYQDLYRGIDLRMRQEGSHPEYDLLLEPGADLAQLAVRVEGATGLHIAPDGSLVMETAVGPLTQPVPRTWQSRSSGDRELLRCRYVLLGGNRFTFDVEGWNGLLPLTIDPPLLWSTYLGGSEVEGATSVFVGATGVVTVAGTMSYSTMPTTMGAYSTTYSGGQSDAFISRLDPSQAGSRQLMYSTFFGGDGEDRINALSVDANGVVTVVGYTDSSNFPTTNGAFRSKTAGLDGFVARLDPRKAGSAQLTYSTVFGGSGIDAAWGLSVDASGVVTVAGNTMSNDLPTTTGAYDRTFNGTVVPFPGQTPADVFVARLDPSKTGEAQCTYSTYLGGKGPDSAGDLVVDANGVVVVVGMTASLDFPVTANAYDTTHNYGLHDGFISLLDPSKTGSAQLFSSTFFGGADADVVQGVAVDASGAIVVVGATRSEDFPITPGAYDTKLNGVYDTFLSRLAVLKEKTLVLYSTYLGGKESEGPSALSLDADGVVTILGLTQSADFPTTAGAFDTSYNRQADAFITRLDPRKSGNAQLVYSTFLGGSDQESVGALATDESGVVTIAGYTSSTDFPATGGAYDTTYNGGQGDAFVSRLDMGVALRADVHQLPLTQAGTQTLTLDAGKQHAGRSYWIFGSASGARPGITLGGFHVPLNPDLYTDLTITQPNTTVLTRFQAKLDASGMATAAFNVPSGLPQLPSFTLHHAYLVYDAQGWHMASNAVPILLRN